MVTKRSTAAAKKPVALAASEETAAPKAPKAPAARKVATPKVAATPKAPAAPEAAAALTKPRPLVAVPSPDERIRLAAYLRFEARGASAGDAVADWLAAELQIAREDAAAPAPAKPRARSPKT